LEPIAFAVKSGTTIGGVDTYLLSQFFIHPEYDGTVLSPDVALMIVEAEFLEAPSFLSRQLARDLGVGQPIATLGFPGEIDVLNTTVPIATFKDGTISALRPYDPGRTAVNDANNKIVQHNLDLSGGTSGSPIFDHQGRIVSVNNAGTETLVIDQTTGEPERIPSGNIGISIRVDEVWDIIELVTTLASGKVVGQPFILTAGWPLQRPRYGTSASRPLRDNWDDHRYENQAVCDTDSSMRGGAIAAGGPLWGNLYVMGSLSP